MKVILKSKPLAGKINAPPSKSAAHRAIIAAALSCGSSHIENIALSEDIKATAEAVNRLCADVEFLDNGLLITGGKSKASSDIFANESGSTLRFLIPLCLDGQEHLITGAERLFARPLDVYEDIFKKDGVEYLKGENFIKLRGRLKGGEYEVPGDISSQFITGLLFALPKAKCDSKITVTGEFESKSYVLMTLDTLKRFGIEIDFSENEFFICGNQTYKPADLTVEGDWSNAAFFEALPLFDSKVELTGLLSDSLQGDRVCVDYFEKIIAGNAKLSLKNCPDLAPILFVVAAEYGGAYFSDTKRLRLKESDRALAMAEELGKMGVSVKVEENSVTVGGGLTAPEKVLCSHNDHRIAMALSVALTKYGGEIEGAEACKKSMPNFYGELEKLGAEVYYEA